MDHQTQVNGASATSPARNVARNMADVWHDVVNLSELQVKLTALDAREALEQSRSAILLIAAGCCLALAALPILLAAAALWLIEQTSLTPATAFALAALVGIVFGGGLVVGGWLVLRRGFRGFQRSAGEFSRNIDWLKTVLAHRGVPPPRQGSAY